MTATIYTTPLQQIVNQHIQTSHLTWTSNIIEEFALTLTEHLLQRGYTLRDRHINPDDWKTIYTLTKGAFEVAGKANPTTQGF